MQAPALVGPDNVEGVGLSDQVGAVVRNLCARLPYRDPLASERNPTTRVLFSPWLLIATSRGSVHAQDAHAASELCCASHKLSGSHPALGETHRVASRLMLTGYEHPIAIGCSRRSHPLASGRPPG